MKKFANVIIKTEDETAIIHEANGTEPSFLRFRSPEISLLVLSGIYLLHYIRSANKTITYLYKFWVKSKCIVDIIRNKHIVKIQDSLHKNKYYGKFINKTNKLNIKSNTKKIMSKINTKKIIKKFFPKSK